MTTFFELLPLSCSAIDNFVSGWSTTKTDCWNSIRKPSLTPLITRRIYLKGEIGGGLKAVRVLPITIEYRDNKFLAFDEIIGVNSDGDTEWQAWDNYKLALKNFYQTVLSQAQQVPLDMSILNALKKYITEIE